MTKYARDEFDRVPETSTRQGVHRTVSAPRARRLAPILSVGAVALVIGLVAFLLMPKLGFGPAGGSTMTADQASNNAAASAAATSPAASPAPSAGGDPTASAAPAAPSPSNTPSATPSPAVDKTQQVAVYNGTTTAGLAGRVGSMVTSAGWVAGPLGNWGGPAQQSSVVFYNGPAQKANAEALGSLLGIGTFVDSAEFSTPLAVVLGPDYR
jgi:cytoskeletal protein RodZ